MKGTTLVAFPFQWYNGKEHKTGLMAGYDSRLSTKQTIVDMGDKILNCENIRVMLAGNGTDCDNMCAYLTQQLSNRGQAEPLKVSDVAEMVITHLNHALDQHKVNTSIGSLIVGWDEKEGSQVYRTRFKNGRVQWKLMHNCASVGSGRDLALEILEPQYGRSCKMSPETAAKLVLKALYNATIDKYTGGPLNVLHLDKDGWHEMHVLGAMDAYSMFFDHMDFTYRQERTLFLLCYEHIFADDLITYLRQTKNDIRSASQVAKIGDIFFHRIYCRNLDVASVVFNSVQGSQHSPPSLEEFPHGMYLDNGVPIYVQWSSKKLLEYLCTEAEEKKEEKSCQDNLEVYLKYHKSYFNVDGYEERTLFVVTNSKRLGGKNLKCIKQKFSPPQGEGVIAAYWVGKRAGKSGDLNFYRFFFRSEGEAFSAYQYMEGIANRPDPLEDIPFMLGMCLDPTDPTDPNKPVYVARSSMALLESICRLPVVKPPMEYRYILKKPVN